MKRALRVQKLTGSQRLTITSDIFDFIRQVVVDGVKDMLGPKATRADIEQEVRRRYLL